MSLPAALAKTAKAKPGAPGRPKDPSKGLAILEAAKRLFLEQGYDGVSMDQIAAEAGVSKLTVYSHFGDKDSLFTTVVKAHCEQQLPTALFNASAGLPLRECLSQVAGAFAAMVFAPEAIAGHRMMCTPQMAASSVPARFWEAGPDRIQEAMADLLAQRVAAGELDIADPLLAASQFFTLLKGEPHMRMVLGCEIDRRDMDRHVEDAVDMFLRAYARAGRGAPGA